MTTDYTSSNTPDRMDLPVVGLVAFARQVACPDWDRLDGADVAVLGVPIDLDLRSPSPSTGFPTPIAAKASPMPTHQRFGSNNHENRKDRREPAIELDEEPAVVVREASPALQLASQDDQLMSKHCILRLKPHLRLEWRGQDGQDETQKPDHSASLGDSVTSSTRIGFSVHTGVP